MDTIRRHYTDTSRRRGIVKYPLLENRLHSQFLERRIQGKRVKRWWFNAKTKEIMSVFYPDNNGEFKMSLSGFKGFADEKAFLYETHAAQKSPNELRESIEQFHAKIIRQRKRGTYTLRDFANMDQTTLTSGLDKRQLADDFWERRCLISINNLQGKEHLY